MGRVTKTFRQTIEAALKNPDAQYGIADQIHTFPIKEIGQSWVTKSIDQRQGKAKGEIAIGFGGFINFDLAINSKPLPEGVILCDINSNQTTFWLSFFDLVKECPTLNEFKTRFSAILTKDIDEPSVRTKFRHPSNALNSLQGGSFFSNIGFLSDESKYQDVRKLTLEDKVSAITLDVLDKKRYELLSGIIQTKGYFVRSLYLSNIRDIANVRAEKNEGDFYGREFENGIAGFNNDFWRNQLLICNPNTIVSEGIGGDGRYDYDCAKTAEECVKKFLNTALKKLQPKPIAF